MNNSLIENFKIPAYKGDNINSIETSFSTLNYGDNNLYNSIYSDQVSTNNNLIIKNNMNFGSNMNVIDPYFYKDKPGDAMKCADECNKVKQCSSFTYDKNSEMCKLYNTIPN